MKKTLIVASLALLCSVTLKAQTALKKVYDEKADPIEQIDKALLKAENENKFVICVRWVEIGVRGVCVLQTS